MSEVRAPDALTDAEQLDAATDQAIAACGGDAREAVKALLVANEFLEREIEEKVFARVFAGREARAVQYVSWLEISVCPS